MEADGSNVHLGPVPPGSEAGTPPPGELVEQLRAEVSTLREHIDTAKMNRLECQRRRDYVPARRRKNVPRASA